MIHYQLRCEADHAFDGWFRDAAAFEAQATSELIACPECGGSNVRRALMAPAVKRGRAAPVIDQSGQADPAPDPAPSAKAAMLPDGVRAVLQKLRAEVEKNCEHVGDRFADEALAIHRGTAEARGIYGESTPEQAEALADEGVQIARIPWVPRADG